MKNKMFIVTLGLLLALGISALGLTLWRVDGLSPIASQVAASAPPAQAVPSASNAAQFAGEYSGVVKLQFVVAGLYSDTLPSQPITDTPDLGSIDLALTISQTGNALSGYVSLDKTLVFSVEHTIQKDGKGLEIGPTFQGSFAGTKLTLLSERVSCGPTIQRQFWISATISQSDGSQFAGQYRETVWGVAPLPVTVVGSFILQRPVFGKNVLESSNKTPTTVADTASTTQATAVTINVLANDTDANGDALTITSVSKPQFGTATTNGQTVIYTPNANFVGSDNIAYFVSDGNGGTAAGAVTITVNKPGSTNHAPTATNDTATTLSGNAVTINVLLNDSDPDGDALAIAIDVPPVHGTTQVANSQIRYTPNAGFSGTDTLTYIIVDGKGGSATATVTITVTSQPNDDSRSVYLPIIQR